MDKNRSASLGSKGVDFVDAYIDTNTISLIETEEVNYYTLKIVNNNPNEKGNVFYNLVFEQNIITGEVTSVIIQYNPELSWLFDKSQGFKGDIIKFDNELISIEDLTGDINLDGELRGSIIPCSISAGWECPNGHSGPGPYGDGTKTCGGSWVITIGPGCGTSSSGGSDGSGGNTGNDGPGGDGSTPGGGGSIPGSGTTQTVVLEICDGFTNTGMPGNSEDCEDDYAAYFTPYICEEYVDINFINNWASHPSNRNAATDLANYLANNYPKNNLGNCAEVDFEDPLENYDFNEESPEILIFEQDYKNRMSQAELAIFDNLNRLQQLDYLHSAYLAQEYAKYYFENTIKVQYNGKGDAYRHTLWNAIGAAKLGANFMEQLANAHEVPDPGKTNNPVEKAMDLHNNQIGRDIGSQSIFMLMLKVKLAVDRGETKYISPTASNGSVIPGVSQIIPTNQ